MRRPTSETAVRLLPLVLAVLTACGGGDGSDDTGTQPGGGGGGGSSALASISVGSTSLAVSAGSRQTLGATGLDASGKTVTGTTFTYSSGTPTVAFVSPTGTVLGLSTGSSVLTITGTAGGVSKTTTVTANVAGALGSTATVVAGATTNDFQPNLVAISRNGAVTWNFPGILHNVQFTSATGTPANIPDTGNQPSGTGTSRTFTASGTFNYSCSLHAGMTGTVVVP